MRSSRVGSAQCRSSKQTTSGRRARKRLEGTGERPRTSPRSMRPCLRMRSPPEQLEDRLSALVLAQNLSDDLCAAEVTEQLGQGPEGDPFAVGEAAADRGRRSVLDGRQRAQSPSRDLPIPAGPRTVKSRQLRSLDRALRTPAAAARAPRRARRAVGRAGAPRLAPPGRPLRSRRRPTSSDLPLTGMRSSGPALTASWTSG